MNRNTKPYTIMEGLGYLVPVALAAEMAIALQLTAWLKVEFTEPMGAALPDILRWACGLAEQRWVNVGLPLVIIAAFAVHYHSSIQRKMTALLWLAVGNTAVLLWCLTVAYGLASTFSRMSHRL